MLTPGALTTLLRAHGIRLTKRLGQHHLIDPRRIDRLIAESGIRPHDTVVEIGAGLGAITESLAQRAGRVIAVEVDRRICQLLAERLAGAPNVELVCDDILTFPWARTAGAVVIGAIPYHITSPILVTLFHHRRFVRHAVLILQDDVVDRLIAKPGTKAYGRLSVLVQCGWQVKRLFRIPPSAFFPQPSVESGCLELIPRTVSPVTEADESGFFELVKTAFAQRRKTLAHALVVFGHHRITKRQAEDLLNRLGLPPRVRAEQLSIETFGRLWAAVRQPSVQ